MTQGGVNYVFELWTCCGFYNLMSSSLFEKCPLWLSYEYVIEVMTSHKLARTRISSVLLWCWFMHIVRILAFSIAKHRDCIIRQKCVNQSNGLLTYSNLWMFLPLRHSKLFHYLICNLQIQYNMNTWNAGCMHYLLLCQANLGQAFRLSGTTVVKNACINFEYVSKPVNWRMWQYF